MIKMNNAKTWSPWGRDTSTFVFSATNVLGVDVRLDLSVLITSLMGRNPRYIFAFSNPMDRSCNWHVHKP